MTGVTEKGDMMEEQIGATGLFLFWFYQVWIIQQTAVHTGLELKRRWEQKRRDTPWHECQHHTQGCREGKNSMSTVAPPLLLSR